MPEPVSGNWIRVILGPEAFELVHAKSGVRVTIPPVGREAFGDKTVTLVPVLPISGTVQDAMDAYSLVWSQGWQTAYWAFQWPEALRTVPEDAEAIRQFWSTIDASESPVLETP